MRSVCAWCFLVHPPLWRLLTSPKHDSPVANLSRDLLLISIISEVGGVAVFPRCLGARCAYVADLIGKNVHRPAVKLCHYSRAGVHESGEGRAPAPSACRHYRHRSCWSYPVFCDVNLGCRCCEERMSEGGRTALSKRWHTYY